MGAEAMTFWAPSPISRFQWVDRRGGGFRVEKGQSGFSGFRVLGFRV